MKKIKVFIVCTLLLSILLTIFYTSDNYFSIRSANLIKYSLNNSSESTINQARKIIANEDTNSLIDLSFNEHIEVSALSINTSVANSIIERVSLCVRNSIEKGDIKNNINNIYIPLGSMISKSILSTKGPNIKVRVSPIITYNVDLLTSSNTIGINNTLVEVYIRIKINLCAYVPLISKDIETISDIVLVSEVIKGEVPVQYSNS